jgi:hypothetical protein
MSTFDVLEQHGTATLLKFLAAVALFVTLHLIRIPLILVARALEVAMRRVDTAIVTSVSTPATRPHNHHFTA